MDWKPRQASGLQISSRFNSGAALATVVGVLIEVPVMLSVVKIVNMSRVWYEAGSSVRQRTGSETPTG